MTEITKREDAMTLADRVTRLPPEARQKLLWMIEGVELVLAHEANGA